MHDLIKEFVSLIMVIMKIGKRQFPVITMVATEKNASSNT